MEILKRTSPNFYPNRNNIKIDKILIVNHITEGSYASSISWLTNSRSKVSAHFVVSKKGEIAQLVDLKDGSWANGTSSNPNSKIYHRKALNRHIIEDSRNANLYTVSIEHEGIYAQRKGALSEEQYQATLWLHKHIISEIKKLYDIDIPINRDYIIGHRDVMPKVKPYCPGDKFPFDRLIKDLTSEEMTVEEAKSIIKEKVGLTDETINYLWSYRFGDELLIKLAKSL